MSKKKNKSMAMPTDIAKAIWEGYSNDIKNNWVKALEVAVDQKDWLEVILVIDEMKNWEFEFNKGNK